MLENLVTTKRSPLTVDETVSRLLELLATKSMKVFAVVDHSGEAAAAGLSLRDTKLVIFGSPKAGTPVMQAVPLAALDLPLKMLVWTNGKQTQVSYTKPSELARRYDLGDELAGSLAGVDGLTDTLVASHT